MTNANLASVVEKATQRAVRSILSQQRKPASKSHGHKPDTHMLNLRCPKEGCEYFAKTTDGMLKEGRLKCPKCKSVLRTKDERGETRGRHIMSAAA